MTRFTGQDGAYLAELWLDEGLRSLLWWEPQVSFAELVRMLVAADLERLGAPMESVDGRESLVVRN